MPRRIAVLLTAVLVALGYAVNSFAGTSTVALTTYQGQFSAAGWYCAGASGILPAGVDPAGAACARTFSDTAGLPRDLGPAPSIADLEAASPSGMRPPPTPAGPGTWRPAPRTEPLRRTGAQIAADPIHHQVVLFGGYSCQGASCHVDDDTWTWNGTSWTQQHPATSPPGRYYGSMTFDPASKRLLLFGGVGCGGASCDALTALADTWTWDGTTWKKQDTLFSPGPRYLTEMTGDAGANETVLFGGCLSDCPAVGGDTWIWNGTSWSLAIPATAPPARGAAGMAYDAAHGQVVLFGGVDALNFVTANERSGQDYDDTWTWDGSTWTQQRPATSPPAREAMGVTYDAARGVVVMYGGYKDDEARLIDAYRHDTWLWDGSSWTEETGQTEMPRTQTPGLAYDDVSRKTLLVSGLEFQPVEFACAGCGVIVHEKQTWLLDALGWTQVPSTWPDERSQAGMAFEPKTGTDVLVGGWCSGQPDFACHDTWSWDGTRWTRIGLPNPSFRWWPGVAAAYDARTKQLLAFSFGSTWALKQTRVRGGWSFEWTLADGNGPRRDYPTIARDATGSVVLFGGIAYDASYNASWPGTTLRWNGTQWIQLTPSSSPAARTYAQMAYDPVRHRSVLFGGFNCGAPLPLNDCPWHWLADTWTWDGSVWTKQQPATSPPGHALGVLVNDPGIQRSLLFGGETQDATTGGIGTASDTWSWGGTSWMQEQPSSSPENLVLASGADLPPNGTAVLFGGQQDNPGRQVSDTWTWSP